MGAPIALGNVAGPISLPVGWSDIAQELNGGVDQGKAAMRAIQIASLDGPQAAKLVEIDEPDRRRCCAHRRPRRGSRVSRCAAVTRALPVQAGHAVHPWRGDRRRRAQRPRRRSRLGRRSGVRADDAVRGDGGSRGTAAGSGVQAARLGVVRGGRGPAVQRPDDASRIAHPRPACRRRDRPGARRGGRHRHVDAATGSRMGRIPHHRGGQHRGQDRGRQGGRARPMWCWPTASRTR